MTRLITIVLFGSALAITLATAREVQALRSVMAERELLASESREPYSIRGFTLPGDAIRLTSSSGRVNGPPQRELTIVLGNDCFTCTASEAAWIDLVKDPAWTSSDRITLVLTDADAPAKPLGDALAATSAASRVMHITDSTRFQASTGVLGVPLTLLQDASGNALHMTTGRFTGREASDIERLLARRNWPVPTRPQASVSFVESIGTPLAEACTPYAPEALRAVDRGAEGWSLNAGEQTLALMHNADDARKAMAVARQATALCQFGSNSATDPVANGPIANGQVASGATADGDPYLLRYWKLKQRDEIATLPENDCVAYDPAALTMEFSPGPVWRLADGKRLLHSVGTERDAKNLWRMARQSSRLCFVGRGSQRANARDHVSSFWR